MSPFSLTSFGTQANPIWNPTSGVLLRFCPQRPQGSAIPPHGSAGSDSHFCTVALQKIHILAFLQWHLHFSGRTFATKGFSFGAPRRIYCHQSEGGLGTEPGRACGRSESPFERAPPASGGAFSFERFGDEPGLLFS